MRHGNGIQIELEQDLKSIKTKYTGQFENDLRSGKGTLKLEDGEEYKGEFFEGLPNGQGTYKFTNGDFYSGEFLDGEMNGEGTYFLMNGESRDGIFLKSRFMVNDIPVPPYLSDKEKALIVQHAINGGPPPPKAIPILISDTDQLVSFVSTSIEEGKIMLLLREKRFKGSLGNIITAFEDKQANFKLSILPSPGNQSEMFEFMFTLRESMESGEFLLVDIDSPFKGEFGNMEDLSDILSVDFLNGQGDTIIRSFRVWGIPEPEFVHPHFALILCGSKSIDFDQSKEEIKHRYPWSDLIERIAFGVIEQLGKSEQLYQTAIIEDSYNFNSLH